MTGYPGYSKPPAGTQLNTTNILTKGLVGCYLFNEGMGLRLNDLSGNHNDGVLTLFEPLYSGAQGWRANEKGISLLFNGTTAWINLGSNSILEFTTNSFSLEALIKTSTASAEANIIAKRNSTVVGNIGYQFFVSNTKLTALICDGSAARIRVDSNKVVNDNLLHHVVATFDRKGLMSIYIDGQLDKSVSITAQQGSISNGFVTRFSKNDSGDGWFLGEIGYGRIWRDTVLTSQQVQDLYANPFSMFTYKASKNIEL